MSSVITSLTTGITISGLWSIIVPIVPFIVIIFGVVFGLHLLRQHIKSNNYLMTDGGYKNEPF